MNFKSIGIPTIKLLVIAAVITILLFLTNNTTEAKIAQNQADAEWWLPVRKFFRMLTILMRRQ